MIVIVVVYLTGKRWIKQMMTSAFLIPILVCGTAFFINFIAIYYHASRAIPFGTMVREHLFHYVSSIYPNHCFDMR